MNKKRLELGKQPGTDFQSVPLKPRVKRFNPHPPGHECGRKALDQPKNLSASTLDPHPRLQADAAQRVLAAVITQAVEDYRAFEKRGMIVKGRVMAPARPARGCRGKKYHGLFVERYECERLVGFFSPGGSMDFLIALGRLCVSGEIIRKRLGMATDGD